MRGQRVRTVELQLLRQGPPHNQLLSPLTNYLALCGDHPNTTLNFPLEHQSLKVRLHALRYKDSEETRKIQLYETASIVGQMFAEVPGLISELGARDSRAETLVHLSVATTASELSLVPFELATSPPGFPGSGGYLSLQTEFPVCITRRSRKVRFETLKWDVAPRILMVASNAGGDVPTEAHYTLLRQLIEPWVNRNPLVSGEAELAEVRQKLVLLENATVRSIQQSIKQAIDQQNPFTHVHILAHGCPLPNQDESYGVALHHPTSRGIDAVDGMRLGQLLSGTVSDENHRVPEVQQVRPNVVTLAVCDSGNQGLQVERPGASVAFNIHEAGIPLVIGSQFPLTIDGSVILTDSVYRQLLDGKDPRVCLWEARRELFAQSAEKFSTNSIGRHDWASVVAFAALPHNIHQEVRKFERSQQRKRMNVKLKSGDHVLEAMDWISNTRSTDGKTPQNKKLRTIVDTLAGEVTAQVRAFDQFVDEQRPADTVSLLGISASANKRAAELLRTHQKNKQDVKNKQDISASDEVWLRCVRQSYRRYLLISRNDSNKTWAYVQALFLKRFLSFYKTTSKTESEDSLYHDWFRAMYLTQDHEIGDGMSTIERIWYLSDQIELGLLRLLIGRFQANTKTMNQLANDYSQKNMTDWLNQIERLEMAGDRRVKFAAYAGRRQLLRYRRFAEMLFVDTRPEKDMMWKQRVQGRKQDGFTLLVAKYKKFDDVYSEIETRVKEQIEVGEDG